jgi:hypothetical protein
VRTLTVLPGATVPILDANGGTPEQAGPDDFALRATAGGAAIRWEAARGATRGPRPWYVAPSTPGVDRVRAHTVDGRLLAEFLVFVLVPPAEVRGGFLRGYRIGAYPPAPPADSPRAVAFRTAISGFVEVSAVSRDLPVSAHVRLGELACKQQPGHEPAYLALDVRILDKLEHLIDRLAAHGIPPGALTVMSGYRTPYYNATIGNDTAWSRHTIGDSVDVFVDADGDGIMDDIDGDGRTSLDDARALLAVVEALDAGGAIPGGAAAYPATPWHGPFVHLDVRGYRARW